MTERGEAMQVCAEDQEGTMAAVLGLDDNLVESACHRVDDDVWVANFNAPGQVVIAGSPERRCRSRRGRERARGEALHAAASLGEHSTRRLWVQLAIGCARRSIRSNSAIPTSRSTPTSTRLVTPLPAIGRRCCRRSSRARFVGARHCTNSTRAAFTTFVEVGPGTVLTGMAKRTAKGARTLKVGTPG